MHEINLECQCCFCGEGIIDDGVEPLQLAIQEASSWKNGGADPWNQALFAHVDCLGSRLHQSVLFLNHRDRLEE